MRFSIYQKYTLYRNGTGLVACILGLALLFAGPPEAGAAGMTRGVPAMGAAKTMPYSPPPPSYSSSPRDYQRGYVGNAPGSDPWNRDSDFKARDYQFRHGPPPQMATPPSVPHHAHPDVRRTPSLAIPRLPRESALPPDNTDVGAPRERLRGQTPTPVREYRGIERRQGLGGGR